MKSKILLLYSSVDGHTQKICQHIANRLLQKGDTIETSSADYFYKSPEDFDLLILASSIRYGKHHENIERFIRMHSDILNRKKTVFISVNLVARKAEKSTATTNPYVVKFFKNIPWKPTHIEVFAGKLDYKKYSFTDRILIQLIMLITKGPLSTDTPIEYTDWTKVDAFCHTLQTI